MNQTRVKQQNKQTENESNLHHKTEKPNMDQNTSTTRTRTHNMNQNIQKQQKT